VFSFKRFSPLEACGMCGLAQKIQAVGNLNRNSSILTGYWQKKNSGHVITFGTEKSVALIMALDRA